MLESAGKYFAKGKQARRTTRQEEDTAGGDIRDLVYEKVCLTEEAQYNLQRVLVLAFCTLKLKAKFSPERTIKSQRERRGIALLFL